MVTSPPAPANWPVRPPMPILKVTMRAGSPASEPHPGHSIVKHYLLAAFAVLGLSGIGRAEVKTSVVEYEYEGAKLKGFLAVNDDIKGKRPGVLVVHEWWGLDDHARERATDLAKLGYVAFCPDMYGEGKVVDHPKEAGEMSGMVRKNVKVWQGRAAAGLKVLTSQAQTDSANLAAIGYCFGGSTALQLAYSGADLKAVVTFHAGLPTPTPEEAKAVKARVLVCNGADDTFVSPDSIAALKAAMKNADKTMEFENYPDTVHSFTVKGADKRMLKGMAYNAAADEKSWASMKKTFEEAFAK